MSLEDAVGVMGVAEAIVSSENTSGGMGSGSLPRRSFRLPIVGSSSVAVASCVIARGPQPHKRKVTYLSVMVPMGTRSALSAFPLVTFMFFQLPDPPVKKPM